MGDRDQLQQLMPFALAFMSLDPSDYGNAKDEVRNWARRDPMDALLTTVLGGGVAFYLAEREGNPNCPTVWDGIMYMATCLSVGYDNNFPTTPIGHGIASIVQTFGPALSGMAFDTPAADAAQQQQDAAETAATQRAILARLEDIVGLLQQKANP